jgi:hypothetical protein
MPFHKTISKVFVGSSKPEPHFRERAMETVRGLSAGTLHERLGIEIFDYRQLVGDSVSLQTGIDRHIQNADLVVLVVGARVGGGLMHETELALQLLANGTIKGLWVYLLLPHLDNSASAPDFQRARSLLEDSQVLYYEATSLDHFATMFSEHFAAWLAEERSIVVRERDFLKLQVLETLVIWDLSYTDDIQELHRLGDADPDLRALSAKAFHDYLTLPPASISSLCLQIIYLERVTPCGGRCAWRLRLGAYPGSDYAGILFGLRVSAA